MWGACYALQSQFCYCSSVYRVTHMWGAFTQADFVSGVLKEIGCSLCRYHHRIEHAVAGYFALGAGKSFMRGLPQSDAELSSEDSS
jgi:hypothetical protein